MRLLLDTHTFLWWVLDDRRLSKKAAGLIRDPDNELLMSVATGWEIAIKCSLGRIELPEPPSKFIPDQIRRNDLAVLDITMHHALEVYSLPPNHGDPFDRILIAQGRTEDIPIITRDPAFNSYDIETVW